jgi:hypothetical protein
MSVASGCGCWFVSLRVLHHLMRNPKHVGATHTYLTTGWSCLISSICAGELHAANNTTLAEIVQQIHPPIHQSVHPSIHPSKAWIGLDWIGLDWIGLDWIATYSQETRPVLRSYSHAGYGYHHFHRRCVCYQTNLQASESSLCLLKANNQPTMTMTTTTTRRSNQQQ